MSLSGALSNALSGLTAMSRSANVVSDNLANALSEAYGRREISLTSRRDGGVGIEAINRIIDRAVLADRRLADAEYAEAGVKGDFLATLTSAIGEPGSGASVSDALSAVETALVEASAAPESEAALTKLATAFDALAQRINSVSDTIETRRTEADHAIGTQVDFLNRSLAQVEKLNRDIQRSTISGADAGALLDQRQKLIDQISQIVPVKEVDRGQGTVALMTPAGAMLLDGKAAVLEFGRSNVVTAVQSLAGGTLSGITLNGTAIDMSRRPNALSGGSLAGNFEVRDVLGPEAQAKVDALARDLIERFSSASADPTLAGAPGILTDGGAVFDASDPENEIGLAGRLSLNTLVDPDGTNEVWRLRDGLGAALPGDSGQAAGLNRLSAALTEKRVPVSGSFATGARSAAQLASDVLSSVGVKLQAIDNDKVAALVRVDALTSKELANGVDSDQEMSNLLVIEQAYAANARVIEAVSSMLDSLMRI